MRYRSSGDVVALENVSRETAFVSDVKNDPSRTIQSAKEECDINVIVRRFGITGTVPMAARLPHYADYEEVFDYQTAMNAVRRGVESFAALPSHVRKRFSNDPQEFLEFCSDEKNLDEMRALGLAKPKDPVIIDPSQVATDVKEKADAGSTGK